MKPSIDTLWVSLTGIQSVEEEDLYSSSYASILFTAPPSFLSRCQSTWTELCVMDDSFTSGGAGGGGARCCNELAALVVPSTEATISESSSSSRYSAWRWSW